MKGFTISLLPVVRRLFKLSFIVSFLIFFSFFSPSISFPSDLISLRTPSTGYQPQFQVSANKAYYVWHKYDGPCRQIFTAEMNINGTGPGGEKRTRSPYGKYDPQFQIVGNRIYYVWHEDHGPTKPIWVSRRH